MFPALMLGTAIYGYYQSYEYVQPQISQQAKQVTSNKKEETKTMKEKIITNAKD